MTKLQNYALGKWQLPTGSETPQYNAYNGDLVSVAGDFSDYAAMMDFARKTGGAALRKLTFFERGMMLKKLALYLSERKPHYYKISHLTGATKTDSWIDIDGGIGNLFAYASLRRQLGNQTFYVDGTYAPLSKGGSFIGQHVCVPKQGVAIHINAFNFPVWGMLEKCAVNWLAGVPAIVKASEITSFVTESVVRDIVASGILPEGALQFIGGRGHGILDFVTMQDVVTFTGSAATGKILRGLPKLNDHSVPFTMEADSLNAMILGEDVTPDMPEFDIFIKNVRNEIITKTGQKCTAVRRIIVPENILEDVQIALGKELKKVTIGDPSFESVRMGALVSQTQRQRVHENIQKLLKVSQIVVGDVEKFDVIGADKIDGAFLPPILLRNENPMRTTESHDIEAFGPVATLMPYKDFEQAIELANRGKGSLVSTICSFDPSVCRAFLVNAGAFHGRILFLNRASAKESTGHGSPMPLMTHGGPGRAGGGEEMGGLRGVFHYLQRVAVQGHPTMLSEVTQTYQIGGAQTYKSKHPFSQYFDDLTIGETLTTAKHTITAKNIADFADLTGDKFYAHTDPTALEGTPFSGIVAHGYYILSRAAGLFVQAEKGPVLLNYGIEDCRFTKPVYPNSTIGVRFTCKEKIDVAQKDDDTLPPRGIVKWLVDVYDETGETVALATILTMVRRKQR
ncbi:MAG: phenylacetic acid degradation bifunctional protein PaaZ [Saprospiraceae bacterium]|nr:phenylacetic acid degradation bifunctional protein PaaZ [Saprospiraceae bacterium]